MTEHEDMQESEVKAPDAIAEESEDGSEDGINNRRKGDTKVGLTLRVLVAAYVLYLAYDLIQGFGETSGNDRILIAAAIGIFLIGGGAILVLSAKKLIRKEYVDANEDPEDEKR